MKKTKTEVLSLNANEIRCCRIFAKAIIADESKVCDYSMETVKELCKFFYNGNPYDFYRTLKREVTAINQTKARPIEKVFMALKAMKCV